MALVVDVRNWHLSAVNEIRITALAHFTIDSLAGVRGTHAFVPIGNIFNDGLLHIRSNTWGSIRFWVAVDSFGRPPIMMQPRPHIAMQRISSESWAFSFVFRYYCNSSGRFEYLQAEREIPIFSPGQVPAGQISLAPGLSHHETAGNPDARALDPPRVGIAAIIAGPQYSNPTRVAVAPFGIGLPNPTLNWPATYFPISLQLVLQPSVITTPAPTPPPAAEPTISLPPNLALVVTFRPGNHDIFLEDQPTAVGGAVLPQGELGQLDTLISQWRSVGEFWDAIRRHYITIRCRGHASTPGHGNPRSPGYRGHNILLSSERARSVADALRRTIGSADGRPLDIDDSGLGSASPAVPGHLSRRDQWVTVFVDRDETIEGIRQLRRSRPLPR